MTNRANSRFRIDKINFGNRGELKNKIETKTRIQNMYRRNDLISGLNANIV